MITVRRHRDRVHQVHGRRELWQTFGPERTGAAVGLPSLAFVEEERLPPATSSWRRPDRDVEVLLYVREGTVALRLGTRVVPLASGSFLRRPTGNGDSIEVRNASRERPAQVFRIGLVPLASSPPKGTAWRWFSLAQREEALCVVASAEARAGALRLAMGAEVSSAVLNAGRHVVHEIRSGWAVWMHIVEGRGRLGSLELATGDGAGLVDERTLSFTPSVDTELLVVELPP